MATLLGVCVICGDQENVLYSARSFFGVLRVETGHYDGDGDWLVYHTLMHGSTMHGQQSRDPDDALEPWTYYHRSGPVGEVFDALEDREAFLHHGRIGVVGLGTGSVAAYAEPGSRLPTLRSTQPCGGSRRTPILHVSQPIARGSRRSAWAMPG